MGFKLRDNLQCPHLWRTRQCSGWERVEEGAYLVGSGIELSAHPAHKMYHMTVVLHIFVEVHLHLMAVAREVVACQVDQHHVLGVLLRVVAQELGTAAVGLGIARAGCCSGNGIDICFLAFYAAVGLGRRTEDAETAEIEIEQVGAGVHAAQCAIESEVVALVVLAETARRNNLEHVAPEAVAHAAAHRCAEFFVARRGARTAYSLEAKGLHTLAQQCFAQLVHACLSAKGDDCELVIEVVEHQNVAEQSVDNVGRVVLRQCFVLYFYLFKIANGIERRVAVESAVAALLASDVEPLQERIERIGYAAAVELLVGAAHSPRAIGIATFNAPVGNSYAGQRVYSDKRTAVVLVMIVAALHEHAYCSEVAKPQIYPHRSEEVGQHRAHRGGVCECVGLRIVHTLLPFVCC